MAEEDEGIKVDVTRIDISPNPAPLGAELSLEVRGGRDGLCVYPFVYHFMEEDVKNKIK